MTMMLGNMCPIKHRHDRASLAGADAGSVFSLLAGGSGLQYSVCAEAGTASREGRFPPGDDREDG